MWGPIAQANGGISNYAVVNLRSFDTSIALAGSAGRPTLVMPFVEMYGILYSRGVLQRLGCAICIFDFPSNHFLPQSDYITVVYDGDVFAHEPELPPSTIVQRLT